MSLGRPCLLVVSLCLVLAWVAPVSAQPQPLVTFHDLTDVVTATGSGTQMPVPGPETAQFMLFSIPPGLKTFGLDITEGGCISGICPRSDLLRWDGFFFDFSSDSELPGPSEGDALCNPSHCVPETGGVQDVTAFFFDQSLPGAPTSGLIFFQSDLEVTVPAPATLLLLGLGLLTLRRIQPPTERQQKR